MNGQIVTRAYIRAMARAAFEAGKPRDAHNMNWHSPALRTWRAEYDRLANLARLAANRREVATA